ncbi:hypothetical protein Gotur_026819 [Gossypium turneri]
MWEDRYEYLPTREPIIILELACVPEYMPWFRIHGNPYLLTPEERQRQICVERERRGPLNPRCQDDEGNPSTGPKHSPGSSSAAMQSPGPTPMAGWSQMPDSAPFPVMPSGPPMYRPAAHKGSQRGRRGALLFTNFH